MSKNYYIENNDMKVAVSAFGAELQSICYKEIEYLWQGEKEYWENRAPNLYPYIGRLTNGGYTYKGEKYPLDIHGFVKDSMLDVVHATNNSITFCLPITEKIKKQTPFNCIYEIQYTISNKKLLVEYRISNKGEETAYFGVGGHPGFKMPIAKQGKFEDYYLEFSEACKPNRVVFSKENFVVAKQPFLLENNKIMRLNHAMFDEDAIVLENTAKKVMLKSDANKHTIEVEFPQFAYIGFWKMPKINAPYLCIEPWSSLPSRQNIVEEITQQKNLIKLKAGTSKSMVWSVEVN